MSTRTRTAAAIRSRAATPPPAPAPPAPASLDTAAVRHKTATEIAALLRLAELDAALMKRPMAKRDAALELTSSERRLLGHRISRDVLDAYHRALRGGRQPAVARVVGSVCYGCFVRLHAKLDHQLRQRGGIASCPHCLRVIYDPAWLVEASKEVLGHH